MRVHIILRANVYTNLENLTPVQDRGQTDCVTTPTQWKPANTDISQYSYDAVVDLIRRMY